MGFLKKMKRKIGKRMKRIKKPFKKKGKKRRKMVLPVLGNNVTAIIVVALIVGGIVVVASLQPDYIFLRPDWELDAFDTTTPIVDVDEYADYDFYQMTLTFEENYDFGYFLAYIDEFPDEPIPIKIYTLWDGVVIETISVYFNGVTAYSVYDYPIHGEFGDFMYAIGLEGYLLYEGYVYEIGLDDSDETIPSWNSHYSLFIDSMTDLTDYVILDWVVDGSGNRYIHYWM